MRAKFMKPYSDGVVARVSKTLKTPEIMQANFGGLENFLD
jgi:hypothetical protein